MSVQVLLYLVRTLTLLLKTLHLTDQNLKCIFFAFGSSRCTIHPREGGIRASYTKSKSYHLITLFFVFEAISSLVKNFEVLFFYFPDKFYIAKIPNLK